MSTRKYTIKTAALCIVAALIFGALILRGVYLQIIKGPEYTETITRVSSRNYTINASRGGMLDRNGVPLVSSAMKFSIVLDAFNWDKEKQNEAILALCRLLGNAGVSHFDSLPVNKLLPFEYTYEAKDSGAGKRLYAFIAEQKGWPEDPTAAELMALLCEKYDVDPSLPDMYKREICGVRYEMQLREFSAYNPFTFATGMDIEIVSVIGELSLLYPGITIEVRDVLVYDTEYAAHILGRTGVIYKEEYETLKDQGYAMNAIVGKDGLEKALEPYLRGIDGKRTVEVAPGNQVLKEYVSQEPQPGKNCYLTLDIELQKVTEHALAETINYIKRTATSGGRRGNGKDIEGGAVVVIKVATGEILAMASYPTYSLLTYDKDYQELLKDKLAPLYNRATMGAYQPGSTFKMATAVAALEEGIVSPSTKIRDLGQFVAYEDYQPRCWIFRDYGITHGSIDVSEALKYSCNYFFFEVSYELGITRLNQYASALGLGQKTGIELGGENAGNLAGPENRALTGQIWHDGETLQAAIGQTEQQFTVLQLADYVATILNGGNRYRLHLLKEVWDYSFTNKLEEIYPEILNQVDISQSTIEAIKQGMLGVTTEDGTASSVFKDYPIAVGGKTGSAESTNRSAHGVFVSFAPYDNPEIVVCIIGEHAGSGGAVAPICLRIYDYYFGIGQAQTP